MTPQTLHQPAKLSAMCLEHDYPEFFTLENPWFNELDYPRITTFSNQLADFNDVQSLIRKNTKLTKMIFDIQPALSSLQQAAEIFYTKFERQVPNGEGYWYRDSRNLNAAHVTAFLRKCTETFLKLRNLLGMGEPFIDVFSGFNSHIAMWKFVRNIKNFPSARNENFFDMHIVTPMGPFIYIYWLYHLLIHLQMFHDYLPVSDMDPVAHYQMNSSLDMIDFCFEESIVREERDLLEDFF